MEYLLFDLIQNFYNEYPELSPNMVIKLAKKGKEREGFGICSEIGKTDYLAPEPKKRYSLFRPVNKDTELAFLGERIIKDGILFLKVVEDISYLNDIKILIEHYKPKKKGE